MELCSITNCHHQTPFCSDLMGRNTAGWFCSGPPLSWIIFKTSFKTYGQQSNPCAFNFLIHGSLSAGNSDSKLHYSGRGEVGTFCALPTVSIKSNSPNWTIARYPFYQFSDNAQNWKSQKWFVLHFFILGWETNIEKTSRYFIFLVLVLFWKTNERMIHGPLTYVLFKYCISYKPLNRWLLKFKRKLFLN